MFNTERNIFIIYRYRGSKYETKKPKRFFLKFIKG